MKKLLYSIAFASVFSLISCGVAVKKILPFIVCRNEVSEKGNGIIETRTFDVSDFKSINFSGSMNLSVTRGNTCGVSITLDSNLFDFLEVNVKNAVLEIKPQKNVRLKSSEYTVAVTMPYADSICLAGAQKVNVSGFTDTASSLSFRIAGAADVNAELAVQKFSADIAGTSKMRVKGSAERFSCSVAGAAEINAFECKVSHADVSIAGSAHVKIAVEKELKVSGAGAGSVLYRGNPLVTGSVAGVCRIKRCE